MTDQRRIEILRTLDALEGELKAGGSDEPVTPPATRTGPLCLTWTGRDMAFLAAIGIARPPAGVRVERL